MATQKKRKPHKCKNHHKKVARGKCIKCGQWVCNDCVILHHGQFFCIDTCQPQKEKPPISYRPKSKIKTKAGSKTESQIPKSKKTFQSSKTIKTQNSQNSQNPKPSPISPSKPSRKPQNPKTLTNKTKNPNKKNEADLLSFQTPSISPLFLWAGITLGLFGVLFGLYEMRENLQLRNQLNVYKENRAKLINLIKKRNLLIKKLKTTDNNPDFADTLVPKIVNKYKNRNSNRELTKKTIQRALKNYKQPIYEYKPRKLPLTFNNGSSNKKLIALTFDGGAHINAAQDILDTLKSRNITVTMFLTGRFIRRNKVLVKKIIAAGHEIGNHTVNHPHLTSYVTTKRQITLPKVTSVFLGNELIIANEIFKQIFGKDMAPIWRAPYGEKNSQIYIWGQQYGYLHIGWKQAHTWKKNFDTNDWIPDPETPGYYTPIETLRKFDVLSDVKPYGMNGAIILMHLGTLRKKRDQMVHLVLGTIIDQLRKKGYEFVPVTVMLKESGIEMTHLRRKKNDEDVDWTN